MTLLKNEKPVPPAYPLVAHLAGLLWPLPVADQLNGESSSSDVILISNHGPLVKYLVTHQIGLNVLALDAGGFMPAASSAFGHVREAYVLNALQQQGIPPGARIYIPISMASSLRWQAGQQVSEREVVLIPDEPAAMLVSIGGEKVPAPRPPIPAVVRRLLYGLGLCLGQMLIFAVPLWLFSVQTLVFGFAGLLLSSVLLALIWSVSSCCGGAKGLLVGVMLAGLAALGMLVFTRGVPWSGLLLPLLGLCLLSFWMGMVFNGAK